MEHKIIGDRQRTSSALGLTSVTKGTQFSSPDEERKVNLHLERGPLPCDLSMSLLSTALAFSV